MTLEDAVEFADRVRGEGLSLVMCHGVFDVLHLGHVRHLRLARAEGDRLIVSLTDDEFVNKGPGRPYFTARVRAEMLAFLEIVDAVVINHAASAQPILEAIRPDIYAKGSDYANPEDDVTGKIELERRAVEANGGRVVFTEDVVFSSSSLINTHFADIYSDELQVYLRDFRSRVTMDDLDAVIEKTAPLRVLVVGDAIMDEYVYVQSMGKASKENIIATRYTDRDLFAGGVSAGANHMAGLCEHVEVATCLGMERSDEDTIRASLKENVSLSFISRPDASTTRKTRFIDRSYWRKMFEVYDFKDDPLDAVTQREFDLMVEEKANACDVVVVNDFGHGLIAPSTVELLQNTAPFMAVNAQCNAANLGYNLISKYSRADYVCLDEPEARLAVADKHGPIEIVMEKIAERVHCPKIIITRGESGCLIYDSDQGICAIPAFTKNVVDTVGAGDAFLTVTSPLIATGAPMELAGFVGNAAGALKVGIVGHSKSVERAALLNYLKVLLK